MMRLGVVTIPEPAGAGAPLAERIQAVCRQAESLGFAGVWATDAMGRGRPTVDPLILLTAVATATRTIELGTCVLQVPLRHPVELANRVQSLNLLAGGRLRLGVGAGSTLADFQAVQADYEGRFRALPEALAVMRRVWRGEAVFGPALSPWPGLEGGPPVLLGAWRSPRWIDLAARECQGWIASGIYTSWDDLGTGVRMYREAGRGRVVLANVFADLRPEPATPPIVAKSQITLVCSPAEARERLRRLAGLGVDDVLLIAPFDQPAQLEQLRALAPD
jgi:alkanesulfonate monooxygenase SsuD/methylene tetrahydromethanopterin reductase-like flavin-dependent oxidoreductase (luciferase family)